MYYFLFNNDVFVSSGKDVQRLNAKDIENFDFGRVDRAQVCLLDVDIMTAAALDSMPESKDALLSKSFGDRFPGEYVLQDERIGVNQYQVVGARTEKVREIYRRIPNEKIISFTSYAHAIRGYLAKEGINFQQPVAFVDGIKGETFLTFFVGLRFSKTRRFNETDAERMAQEIRRSAIGFMKEVAQENDPITIVTNNTFWGTEFETLFPTQSIIVVDSAFPAIDGLRSAQFAFRFELPEETLKKAKERELKAHTPFYLMSLAILALGVSFFLFWQVSLTVLNVQLTKARAKEASLESELTSLDRKVYRSILNSKKTAHFGDIYLLMRAMIPKSYDLVGLTYTNNGEHWVIEASLVLKSGGVFEPVALRAPFKKALINDVFIKDSPGKQIRIEL